MKNIPIHIKLGIFFTSIIIFTISGAATANLLKSDNNNKSIENINTQTKENENKKPLVKKEAKYENDYILINGIPIGNSTKNRNMMIALVNKSLGTINFIPYNYYTGDKVKNRLSNLSSNDLISFFEKKGIKISDQIVIDQENIFEIYKKELSKLGEDEIPYLEIKNKEGQIEKIKIGNGIAFYDLIKSTIQNNNLGNLEQIYLYVIKRLADLNGNEELKETLALNKANLFYKTKYKLPLTVKKTILTPVIFKGVKILVDKDSNYLNALKTGEFDKFRYIPLTTKEKKQLNGTYKKTLKEKLEEMRKKREAKKNK